LQQVSAPSALVDDGRRDRIAVELALVEVLDQFLRAHRLVGGFAEGGEFIGGEHHLALAFRSAALSTVNRYLIDSRWTPHFAAATDIGTPACTSFTALVMRRTFAADWFRVVRILRQIVVADKERQGKDADADLRGNITIPHPLGI